MWIVGGQAGVAVVRVPKFSVPVYIIGAKFVSVSRLSNGIGVGSVDSESEHLRVWTLMGSRLQKMSSVPANLRCGYVLQRCDGGLRN